MTIQQANESQVNGSETGVYYPIADSTIIHEWSHASVISDKTILITILPYSELSKPSADSILVISSGGEEGSPDGWRWEVFWDGLWWIAVNPCFRYYSIHTGIIVRDYPLICKPTANEGWLWNLI